MGLTRLAICWTRHDHVTLSADWNNPDSITVSSQWLSDFCPRFGVPPSDHAFIWAGHDHVTLCAYWTLITHLLCPRSGSLSFVPVSAFHLLIVPSSEPDTIISPWALIATLLTDLLFPRSILATICDFALHNNGGDEDSSFSILSASSNTRSAANTNILTDSAKSLEAPLPFRIKFSGDVKLRCFPHRLPFYNTRMLS